jgi:hypothetical protein
MNPIAILFNDGKESFDDDFWHKRPRTWVRMSGAQNCQHLQGRGKDVDEAWPWLSGIMISTSTFILVFIFIGLWAQLVCRIVYGRIIVADININITHSIQYELN